jgi:hypothetical protein
LLLRTGAAKNLKEMTMRKLMLSFLVGIVALAPMIAAAQTGSSGSGTSGSGSSAPAEKPAPAPPAGSGGSSSSPSASPSAAPIDFSQYTTQADCEKAGGMWQSASSKCEKK